MVALAILVAGCGTETDPTATDEYAELHARYDEVAEERATAAAQLESARDQIDELETRIGELSRERNGLDDEIDAMRSEHSEALTALRSERDAALEERDAAQTEVEELRLRYDDDLRADLRAEVDAEVASACEEAVEDYEQSIESKLDYDTRWDAVTTNAEALQRVIDCAEPQRSLSEEERELARLAECTTIDVDTITKDPAAASGSCLIVFAEIFQFDNRTGRCAFLANIDESSHYYGYQYDGTGFFEAKSSSNCPELDGVDQNDHVKVWATSTGALTYDTAMGGTNSVPRFEIERIEVVRKA